MISTNNFPSNYANAVTPYSSMGSKPVGEESSDSKNTPFKPVEESAELAKSLNRRDPSDSAARASESPRSDSSDAGPERNQPSSSQQRSIEQLEAEEQRVIARLSARDQEVRAHEQAHKSAGGALAGAASYQYERGPDGVSYAVAGEVPIKLSSGSGNPEEALAIARRVQQAALAPAEPSVQDRQVAAQAAQLEQQALQDISALAREQDALDKQARAEETEGQEEDASESESSRQSDGEKALADRERIERSGQQEQRQVELPSFDVNKRLLEIGVGNVAQAGGLIDQSA